MTSIEASAPGKAVLCGEYAVLGGAPAISMAVNRRARVHIAETGEPFHSVAAPGLHRGAARFRSGDDGAIEWLQDVDGFALLEEVWRCVTPASGRGLALTLDTRPFFREPGGCKLGFGSSAALATALAAGLSARDLRADDLYRTAAVAHRNFQDGKGSGVDVATAVHGGVIGYWMEPARVERLDWPEGLQFGMLWSGRPASTAGKLARLAGSGRGASAAGLGDAAAAVLEAWRRGVAGTILDALGGYTEALRRFSADHDLGVFDGGHRELLTGAAGRELVYKPCGAGGGDIGIVLADEPEAVSEFAEHARAHGFEPLRVLCDGSGAQCESRPR